jgi:hypothetical protein
MTSITGEPICPICHQPSSREDSFFPEYEDGLDVDPIHSMFHRSAFHWPYYLAWPKRQEFAGVLFNRMIADCDQSTLVGSTYVDGDIAVFTTVYEPHSLTILLRETGSKFYVSLSTWMEFSFGLDTIGHQYHDIEKQRLKDVLPRVCSFLPDAQSIISETNWSGTERNLYAPD